jgi:hypothetical protein
MEGVVDATSRVHYAVAEVVDPYAVLGAQHHVPLKMGTFVTAKIAGTTEQNVTRLPRDAFRELDKVLVADAQNELHIRQLEVLRAEGDSMFIRGGLEAGDKIVLTSIESPVQGMKVRIAGEAEPQSDQDDEALSNPKESSEESSNSSDAEASDSNQAAMTVNQ